MPIERIRGHAIVLGVFAMLTTVCNTAANTDLNHKTTINDHFGSRTPRPLRATVCQR